MLKNIIDGDQSCDALFRAVQLQDFGFSVIPVPKGRPFPIRGWQGYRENPASRSDLEGWFQPGLQNEVALLTGKDAGLCVVRVVDWLSNWFRRSFPKALAEARWEGGEYFYYRQKESFENDLAPRGLFCTNGIAVISEHSWVYAPGSRDAIGFEYIPRGDCNFQGESKFDARWMFAFRQENKEFQKLNALFRSKGESA